MAIKKTLGQNVAAVKNAAAGHNRDLMPFEREDMLKWGITTDKLNPLENLAKAWLSEAVVLRKHGQKDMADLLTKHAKELAAAMKSK